MQKPTHDFLDSCYPQATETGGTEHFVSDWSMTVNANVPFRSTDDLATPVAGAGTENESNVAINSSGSFSGADPDNCDTPNPPPSINGTASEIETSSTTPDEPVDHPGTLQAIRTGSQVTDFDLPLLIGPNDQITATTTASCNSPTGEGAPISQVLYSEFAEDSLLFASDPPINPDGGHEYTGWTLDPTGTWAKKGRPDRDQNRRHHLHRESALMGLGIGHDPPPTDSPARLRSDGRYRR